MALILAMASWKVARTSGFASPLKPMWLSLIWTKRKSPAASWPVVGWASARDERTPPATVQTSPVPAQVMHSRKPRRLRPSAECSWVSVAMSVSPVPLPPASLHDDPGGHVGVEGAVVGVGARGGESVRELLAMIQAGGGEAPIVRRHGMSVLVLVDPGHRRAHGDGQCRLAELELLDLEAWGRGGRRRGRSRRRGSRLVSSDEADRPAGAEDEDDERDAEPLLHGVISFHFS